RLHGAYPKSERAQKSAVTFAQLALAKGGPSVAMAEKVLNEAVTSSDADIRRQASLELARLLHRRGDFKAALPKLEQFAKDFERDEHVGEVIYLAADCSMHLALQADV